jgi:hypothetical protein
MNSRPPFVPTSLRPELLAHRYDPGQDAVHFLTVDRATRRAATFHTDQYLPEGIEPRVLLRQEALRLASPPAPVHFIFHSAFCCSTLLANAFDREGLATSMKEPAILNDIVGWRRRGAPPARIAEVMGDALTLLSRPFQEHEAVVIKPSNVLNGLALAMLTIRADARALLLYAPLRLFLTSVAKKGLDGRLWVRELFIGLRTDGLVQRLGFDDKALFGQTDLQIAAAGWLAQQALFVELARRLGPGRVRTIDSETLLDDPGRALAVLGEHFGLGLGPTEIDEILAGPFRQNSKVGGAFGRAERDAERRAAGDAHGDEIDKVARWAEIVAESAGIPLRLPAALMP